MDMENVEEGTYLRGVLITERDLGTAAQYRPVRVLGPVDLER